MRLIFAVLFAVVAGPAVADTAIPANTIISSAIDDYARPNFRQFAEATGELQGRRQRALRDAVGRGADDGTGAVQGGGAGVLAGRVCAHRAAGRRRPDRAAAVLARRARALRCKQVQAALAEKDASATSPETLQGKSVAMQGLVALEYLLFGTGADELATADADYRCDYASAIADADRRDWRQRSMRNGRIRRPKGRRRICSIRSRRRMIIARRPRCWKSWRGRSSMAPRRSATSG